MQNNNLAKTEVDHGACYQTMGTDKELWYLRRWHRYGCVTKQSIIMKFGASLLLLVAGISCLIHVSVGGVVGVPTDLLENLKITDDLPEVPPMVEDEIFERNVYADVLPEARANGK